MKAKDWQKATQLVQERQSQAAMADTCELSSFSFSELPVDKSGPPTVIHRPYVPLSTSTPVMYYQIINKPQKPHKMKLLFNR